ncbi:hypothetical protein HDF11_000437 [Tunturiibacter psychrotolerans]
MSSTPTESHLGYIDQILWSRIIFGGCAALGTLPFFGWPLVLSASHLNLQTIVSILTCVTVFPACVLAFWHKIIASTWLITIAILLVLTNTETRIYHGDRYMLGLLAVPGLFGLISSALHWPPLVDRRK